uniref:Uncharacterized protein n=1 Tax=Chromera velia CCMP2878 TaxID=1169474 RepID=A0A0G4FLG9_9ALVE|eukprot:Cvel_3490.t1-p1 / transcript=Cvel_3490.t1 / gene=Cvel_3490 / organism=Chromera_velia_CCMP2878 / gene_product=3',5'-cyclic-nucleotide phosphodiesterase, putative / transcript_product=3',5'-cyclic-nucleotide phosphodiesterase, putative / location=Cvel_scaffold141:11189-13381(-) / protein_length=480 / sequence_SO=supercontig / SO=protein_coding / is_pseudo=false
MLGKWACAGLLALSHLHFVSGKFLVVVGGEFGGIVTGKTSGYLVTHVPEGSALSPNFKFLALDAGELLNGLHACMAAGTKVKEPCATLMSMVPAGTARPNVLEAAYTALRDKLAGVFISHAPLDHVAGLAMTCPNFEMRNLPVFGRSLVIDHMQKSVFNNIIFPDLTYGGVIWKMMADRKKSKDVKSQMKYYELTQDRCLPDQDDSTEHCYKGAAPSDARKYTPLDNKAVSPLKPSATLNIPAAEAGAELEEIPGTGMKVLASYSLEHFVGGVREGSSAVLIGSVPAQAGGETEELLYFGDHGPVNNDISQVANWQKNMRAIFKDVCLNHLVAGKLKGIFTEVSYDNSAGMLFNHLTPKLLRTFLVTIQTSCNEWVMAVGAGTAPPLEIIIGHRKPVSGTARDVRHAFGLLDTDSLIKEQVLSQVYGGDGGHIVAMLFKIVFAKQGDSIEVPRPDSKQQPGDTGGTKFVEVHSSLRGSKL